MLDDPTFSGDPASVKRVVLASGQSRATTPSRSRDEVGTPVAVLRVEQLYPWPHDYLAEALSPYTGADELVWLQEEPENMGAWNFAKGRLYEALGDDYTIRRISRFESGSPAVGSLAVHVQEQQQIVEDAVVAGV